jgi:hypothetical protein
MFVYRWFAMRVHRQPLRYNIFGAHVYHGLIASVAFLLAWFRYHAYHNWEPEGLHADFFQAMPTSSVPRHNHVAFLCSCISKNVTHAVTLQLFQCLYT